MGPLQLVDEKSISTASTVSPASIELGGNRSLGGKPRLYALWFEDAFDISDRRVGLCKVYGHLIATQEIIGDDGNNMPSLMHSFVSILRW
ncbi:hypothetical protein LOK49_LG04G02595 [Camellia lanceoleosa]|uniref:Uncharacterized protein n=1 Tax=Camellia lanceoleosa TaxID=1840588 RepID=A0ACC0I7K4_9ERIC|nr:hypothetical protein LOK49_LG04G02595 [Camellia lanceoleosa]